MSVLVVVPRVKISFSEDKVFSQRKYRRTKTSYTHTSIHWGMMKYPSETNNFYFLDTAAFVQLKKKKKI